MAKYHVNDKGEPGLCRATFSCPLGGSDLHYPTAEAARAAYEEAQSLSIAPPLQKRDPEELRSAIHALDNAAGEKHWVEASLVEAEAALRFASQAKEESVERYRAATTEETRRLLARQIDLNEREEATAAARRNALLHRLEVVSREHLAAEERRRLAAGEVKQEPTPMDFTPARVGQIAREATAHNYGPTVADVHEEAPGVVSLRMSSWPRAKEAERKFRSLGWLTEFTGDHLGGERIRVFPANSAPLPVKRSQDLLWVRDSNSFVAEASEFGDFSEEGFTLISQKSGSAVRMVLQEVRRDREGDVLEWRFRPEDSSHPWTVAVFND